jgi:hypothetical protein
LIAWACLRLSDILGPLTTTSTGAGEPKLITSLTISAGSKAKRKAATLALTLSTGSPAEIQRSVSHLAR